MQLGPKVDTNQYSSPRKVSMAVVDGLELDHTLSLWHTGALLRTANFTNINKVVG